MLQSVFLMMEGGSGGITTSGPRPMISVRLPVFDSESGTRRNRTWDGVRWQVCLMDCRVVGNVVAMAGKASGFLLLLEGNGRLALFCVVKQC